jgi:hypothetical protein
MVISHPLKKQIYPLILYGWETGCQLRWSRVNDYWINNIGAVVQGEWKTELVIGGTERTKGKTINAHNILTANCRTAMC